MMVKLLDIVISGLLMGGIYALIAVGLRLQYGVARVLNITHGEFIMLAAFGLLFIIQNIAILIWGSDLKGYSYMNVGISIAGAIFAANRLITLGCALIIGTAFYFFLARTRLGKSIRAASQDPHSAGLMGVNIDRVLAICFGLGAMMAGSTGTLISMCYPIDTAMGTQYTIIAVMVVALGGFGSIVGGFILGLIGSIATTIEPAMAMIAYYSIFILLLLIKPKGIFGK